MKLLYKKLTQTQMIAVGYVAIILSGALLLMLPISSRTGQWTGFLDSVFTATSASCVTGLIIADTYQHWSTFGQCIIIGLIQLGGLGFMTIGVFFSILLRRKIGLRTRGVLQESVNTLQIGGIVRLAKKIMIGTLIVEGTGAVLLAFRFVPQFGLKTGIFYGIFHSISAFCNAGFDLLGRETPYVSLTQYVNDGYVNMIIMSLIVIGGIGFFVWNDVTTNKWHVKKYRLHTKIVLVTTAVLIFGGALLFYLMEQNHILKDMPVSGQIWASLFNSVTARTAGFNSTDCAQLQEGTKFMTSVLMFIGGSPGSTAGGIKTTTIVVLLVYMWANLRDKQTCNVFKRRIDDAAIRKAFTVLCTNLFLVILAVMAITTLETANLADVTFEVSSAMATVGMSTGITRELGVASKLILIFLMYCGRIGSLTFALSFKGHKHNPPVMEPVEQITIG